MDGRRNGTVAEDLLALQVDEHGVVQIGDRVSPGLGSPRLGMLPRARDALSALFALEGHHVPRRITQLRVGS